jgi:hypothetical protein
MNPKSIYTQWNEASVQETKMFLLWEITGQYIQLSKQFMQNQQGCLGTNFWVFLLLHINNHNQRPSNQPDHEPLNKIRWHPEI